MMLALKQILRPKDDSVAFERCHVFIPERCNPTNEIRAAVYSGSLRVTDA